MYFVHLYPPLCLHSLMQEAGATAHPRSNRDAGRSPKVLHCRSRLQTDTALKSNSWCPSLGPQENSSSQPTVAWAGARGPAQSLSCHPGDTVAEGPFATPARQHRLHQPLSLCQVPGRRRSVQPALAGGWGRRRWKRSAPSGILPPSLHNPSG